jgi:hypothetical protein
MYAYLGIILLKGKIQGEAGSNSSKEPLIM